MRDRRGLNENGHRNGVGLGVGVWGGLKKEIKK